MFQSSLYQSEAGRGFIRTRCSVTDLCRNAAAVAKSLWFYPPQVMCCMYVCLRWVCAVCCDFMRSAFCSSEEDDTSSIPPEPGPLSKKPSGLYLTLPDFQETETGVYHECVWLRVWLGNWDMCHVCVRVSKCPISSGVPSGAGYVRGVGHQLRPQARPRLHLDHPGTHLAASRYGVSVVVTLMFIIHHYNQLFLELLLY